MANYLNGDTDSAKLDSTLGTLQQDAHGHFEAYWSSHALLRSLLARSYLWWRKAKDVQGYLESLYQQHRIGQKSTGNQPNFNPLIRLVWGVGEEIEDHRQKISQWHQALQSVHKHYSENCQDFSNNAEGKLVDYFEKSGGVDGLRTKGQVKRDEPLIGGGEPLPYDAKEDLSRLATTMVATLPGMGSAIVHESFRVGLEGLVLLLASRDGDGTVTILGSSNNPEEIKKASLNAIRRDLTGLPPQFRALVETISTQAFPSHALPSSPEERATWFQKRFFEDTDLWEQCVDCQPQGPKNKTSKRLLVRPIEGDLLLSSNMTMTSPVTRCIPNDRPFGRDSTYLGLSEISRVERWTESGETSLLRFNGEERVEDLGGEDGAVCALSINDSTSGYSQRLSFYEHAPDRDISHTQGEFDRARFVADWTARVAAAWFGKVREVWADQWFAGLGKSNQITRSHNAVLSLKVEAESISIIFNQQEGAIAPSEKFPLPVRITGHGQRTSFFSKDIAPVLANLADVPATGEIVVSGNKHAIVFEYETPIGRFEIAVPTVGPESLERDGTCFKPADSVFPVEMIP